MVKITSDSTADLEELFEKRNIAVMPLNILLDGICYIDGETIKPQKIFDYYKEKKVLPKTASRSVEDYEQFFKAQTADGSEVVHFCISAEMSSSYNNAEVAARNVSNVRVVDSRSLSTGIGLLVLKACDLQTRAMTAKRYLTR